MRPIMVTLVPAAAEAGVKLTMTGTMAGGAEVTVNEALELVIEPRKFVTVTEYKPALVGCTLLRVRVELVALRMLLVSLKYHW